MSKKELEFTNKTAKKPKGFYLSERDIDYIKAEAQAHGVSENEFLTAIINKYRTDCEESK